MKKVLITLGLAASLAVSAFAQGDAKAQEILKKAKAAIGKEDKIKAMQNVVAEANFKRSMGQQNIEGTIELVMAGGDKVYQSQSMSMFGNEITQIQVLNVDKTWVDTISGIGAGGPGGGGGRFGGGGQGFLDAATQERNRRNGLARVLLGFFLTAPGVDFTYGGEAKAPDGTVADILLAKATDGPVAKLYVDRGSNQVLMLSYKDKDMRAMFRGGPGGQRPPGQAGGQPGGQPGGQAGQGGGQNNQQRIQEELAKLPPEERAKREAEIKAQRDARMLEQKAAYDKAPEVDYIWNFGDYKSEGGLNLPHTLTKSIGGEPNEEWTITKYKFNDKKVTPDKFEKKGK
jgi:hypothetical protein